MTDTAKSSHGCDEPGCKKLDMLELIGRIGPDTPGREWKVGEYATESPSVQILAHGRTVIADRVPREFAEYIVWLHNTAAPAMAKDLPHLMQRASQLADENVRLGFGRLMDDLKGSPLAELFTSAKAN